MTIAVSNLPYPPPLGRVDIRLESESLKIVPSQSRTLLLQEGTSALYVITPKSQGNKKLHVYAQYAELTKLLDLPNPLGAASEPVEVFLPEREVEKVVDIPIIKKPSFWGLPRDTLSFVQAASAALGFPSVILLVITRWLDSRKSAKKEGEGPRIIIP